MPRIEALRQLESGPALASRDYFTVDLLREGEFDASLFDDHIKRVLEYSGPRLKIFRADQDTRNTKYIVRRDALYVFSAVIDHNLFYPDRSPGQPQSAGFIAITFADDGAITHRAIYGNSSTLHIDQTQSDQYRREIMTPVLGEFFAIRSLA